MVPNNPASYTNVESAQLIRSRSHRPRFTHRGARSVLWGPPSWCPRDPGGQHHCSDGGEGQSNAPWQKEARKRESAPVPKLTLSHQAPSLKAVIRNGECNAHPFSERVLRSTHPLREVEMACADSTRGGAEERWLATEHAQRPGAAVKGRS